jgi:hypothetical protein
MQLDHTVRIGLLLTNQCNPKRLRAILEKAMGSGDDRSQLGDLASVQSKCREPSSTRPHNASRKSAHQRSRTSSARQRCDNRNLFLPRNAVP